MGKMVSLVLISLVVIAGCSYSRDQAAKDADYLCAERGGVERFWYSTNKREAEVLCRDGKLEVIDRKWRDSNE